MYTHKFCSWSSATNTRFLFQSHRPSWYGQNCTSWSSAGFQFRPLSLSADLVLSNAGVAGVCGGAIFVRSTLALWTKWVPRFGLESGTQSTQLLNCEKPVMYRVVLNLPWDRLMSPTNRISFWCKRQTRAGFHKPEGIWNGVTVVRRSILTRSQTKVLGGKNSSTNPLFAVQ